MIKKIGGSSAQARAVSEGLQADVVTLAHHRSEFPDVRLVSVEKTFGTWEQVAKVHFAEGGVLDQLLGSRR